MKNQHKKSEFCKLYEQQKLKAIISILKMNHKIQPNNHVLCCVWKIPNNSNIVKLFVLMFIPRFFEIFLDICPLKSKTGFLHVCLTYIFKTHILHRVKLLRLFTVWCVQRTKSFILNFFAWKMWGQKHRPKILCVDTLITRHQSLLWLVKPKTTFVIFSLSNKILA